MKNKWSLGQWWIVLYGASIVLLPPVHFREKQYFWAEILILPLIFTFALRLLKRQIGRPPVSLVLVVTATFAAFVAGRYRGDLGHQFSIYPFNSTDEFALSRDGISFLRWGLIFFTPWLIHESLQPVSISKMPLNSDLPKISATRRAESQFPENYPWLFLQTLKYSIFISGLLSFAHRAHFISLANWGYFTEGLTWAGRSHGTFTAPLEAGMVYALMTLFLGLSFLRKVFGLDQDRRRAAVSGNLLAGETLARGTFIFLTGDIVIFLTCLGALLLTKTGTAFVAMCLAFLIAIVTMPLKQKNGFCLSR